MRRGEKTPEFVKFCPYCSCWFRGKDLLSVERQLKNHLDKFCERKTP